MSHTQEKSGILYEQHDLKPDTRNQKVTELNTGDLTPVKHDEIIKHFETELTISTCSLTSIHTDVGYTILTLLGFGDLGRLTRTCKHLNITSNLNFWNLYARNNGIVIDEPCVNFESLARRCFWKWTTKLGNSIQISDFGKVVSRTQKDSLTNPIILTQKPLNRQFSFFECIIEERNEWLGIGVCDSKICVEGGSTLGTQKRSYNYSLHCQHSTLIQWPEQKGQDHYILKNILKAKDTIRIELNFDLNQISFIINNEKHVFECYFKLTEVELFPCVNIGEGTRIRIL